MTPRIDNNLCPYKGLRVFTEADADHFYGRESEIKSFLEKANKYDFLAVVASRGMGKTSFLEAGIIPRLKQINHLQPSPQIICIRPGINPYEALAKGLLEGSGQAPQQLERDLELSPLNAVKSLKKISALPEKKPVQHWLFVDQWQQHNWFTQLLAYTRHIPNLKLVVAVSAEHWGLFMSTPGVPEFWLDGASLHLLPPAKQQLYRIIAEPAQCFGRPLDAKVIEDLVNQVAEQPDNFPLLQWYLTQQWLNPNERFGPLNSSLNTCIKSLLNQLNPELQKTLPRLTSALILGDESTLPNIADQMDTSPSHTTQLLELLAKKHLISVTPEQGKKQIEVQSNILRSHSALIQKWCHQYEQASQTLSELQNLPYPNVNTLSHQQALSLAKSLEWFTPDKLDDKCKDLLGPVTQDDIFSEINATGTTHTRRKFLGRRLAQVGDSRPGVGCRDNIPDINWIDIPGGDVSIVKQRRYLPNKTYRNPQVSTFKLARYPITVKQYCAFLEDDQGWNNPKWWGEDLYRDPDGDQLDYGEHHNHPAQYVNWFDAMAYCRWITKKLQTKSLISSQELVRLPTEWEWQLAATNGASKTHYPWGDDLGLKSQNHRANSFESRLAGAVAVGMYPEGDTKTGLQDMAGNVFEWCISKFKDPSIEHSTPDDLDVRSVRGGSWLAESENLRCHHRRFDKPDQRYVDVGFRLLLCTHHKK